MKALYRAIVRWLYKETIFYQEDNLNSIFLGEPKFYKPSVDSELLLNWSRVFERMDWIDFPDEIRSILKKSIVLEESHIEQFDFSKIQSLSNSKGFGCISNDRIHGSWFKDAEAWGKAMYPSNNLSGLDDEDWSDNIWHIEREGFSKNRAIKVEYYEWIDRYQGIQSGGSHHAAMVIHQMKEQGKEYKREAIIKHFSVNTDTLKPLSKDYYIFVTSEKASVSKFAAKFTNVDLVFEKIVSKKLFKARMYHGANHSDSVICVIRKSDILIDLSIFDKWYEKQIEHKRLVPLIELMTNTLQYCQTPYIHEINWCFLGDPCRGNDKLVKQSNLQ